MSEKLQKVLARAGLGSRRELETWIAAGRVKINNETATLGDRVEPTDKIHVDDTLIPAASYQDQPTRLLIYNKPEGEVCSRYDPEGRPIIFDALPPLKTGRWINIGRLDINTTGLLLVTNDGELANHYMHPSHGFEREYAVRVLGGLTQEERETLLDGVELDDGPAKFERITEGEGEGINHWYHVVLTEGRNREIRRIFNTMGLQVSRLIRIRYGDICLPRDLEQGQYREIQTDT